MDDMRGMDSGMGMGGMGMGSSGMGMGMGMDGLAAEALDPADNRYVDTAYEPITGATLRAAFQSSFANRRGAQSGQTGAGEDGL